MEEGKTVRTTPRLLHTPLTISGLGLGLALATPVAAQRTLSPEGPAGGPRLIPLMMSGAAAPRVLLVDPLRYRVVASLPTGPDARGVALSPDGRFAYVTSYAWEPEPTGSGDAAPSPDGGAGAPPLRRGVTVIDLEARSVHAVFQPRDYRQLGAIAVGEGGARLWMTSEAENGVVEVDARTGEVMMLWRTGGQGATDIAVSRDGRRVFTTNSGSDDVAVIDRLTVLSRRVPTGRRPGGVAVAPAGDEVWVVNSGDHTISVFGDFDDLRELRRFPSGGEEPVRIAFHAGRREAWISHRASRTVTVAAMASGERIGEISLPGEPREILFSDDGARAYILSPASQRVYTIAVASRRLVSSSGPAATPRPQPSAGTRSPW